MIQAAHLQKRFGEIVAVRDVSLSAEKGEVLGFLGPNGAGKTTTLRMLTTFLSPSGGTACVAGFDVIRQSHEVRRRIGYLPEVPPLYGEMTVLEYLEFVARIRGLDRRRMRSAVADVIERCSLGPVRRRLCDQLSRGFRQRAGIAQAIVHDPEVVILDEPTSGLDPQQIVQIRELIASLAGEHTVILSTHILAEVAMICGKVVIISEGRVVREERLDALLARGSLEQAFLQSIAAADAGEG